MAALLSPPPMQVSCSASRKCFRLEVICFYLAVTRFLFKSEAFGSNEAHSVTANLLVNQTRAMYRAPEEATGGGAPQPAELSQLRGAGLWSNVIVPSLVEAGALESPMAAGKKTIQRLKWLMIVVQLGPCATQQHGIKLGNELLMNEDLFGESDSDSSNEYSTLRVHEDSD